jgi:hypothetical protein
MRRRTLLVALGGILAVVVAAGVVVLWPTQPNRITQENYDRIHGGMTRTEVEAILGPPGDYRTGLGESALDTEGRDWFPDSDIHVRRIRAGSLIAELCIWTSWESDSFAINIEFDDSGSVVDKVGHPRRTTQGQLDSFLWRVERQWHRWFPE